MGIWGKGLGRPRSRLGKYLDDNEIPQKSMEEKTGINKDTMSKLCNKKDYSPNEKTKQKVIKVLKEKDKKADINTFW
ncbi:helix-turn-helix domain-containing protein [Chengkuizengella marina]|uniref:Transcriptional regulator n=1 Tax=Chengkuizengella marina TaxID=2507566 RepID=A0A6N9Q2L6_9BACL|nr:transcriptional regulator [Chengkuizengella marina]NBI28994.1 transcriptional regulator [Chengkuizengella marina]